MKKIVLMTAGILGASVLFSTTTLAAQSSKTEGKIEYGSGSLVINPDPKDPTDPTKPVDPETGKPDVIQPGGNINSRLPENLNFGYHENQTTAAEKWVAKNVAVKEGDGMAKKVAAYEAADQTVGALLVEDNRTNEGSWTVKVKQGAPFAINGSTKDTLGATKLAITTGSLWNNISTTGIQVPNKVVSLAPNNNEINVLEAGQNAAAGMTKLNLDKFELEIPANTSKESAIYSADINWTVSETP